MIQAVRADMRYVADFVGAGLDPEIESALIHVPRERFVPAELEAHAFDNAPLPIGEGQTISQPFIVAFMTQLLQVGPNSRVLEVGTGSGYQAAVLAELVAQVYSVEIVRSLAVQAASRLEALGYRNVHVKWGNGVDGWPEQAPFDAVIVTAAGPDIPDSLVAQVKEGGRLVLPVGGQNETQYIFVVEKAADGTLTRRRTIPVRFVPITGSQGGA